MNKLFKFSFYLLGLLIAPWLLLVIGLCAANLFLLNSNEDAIASLEAIRNWDLLLVMGLVLSASLIFYWQEIFNWFAKSHIKTTWPSHRVNKLAKQTHLIITLVAVVHILFILWY